MPSPLRFRPATAADVPAVVALVESAYRGDTSRTGWTTEADLLDGQRTDAAEVLGHLADPAARIILGEDDAGLCASILVKPDQGVGYIGMFAVDPRRQGGGLGAAILAEAERVAADELGLRQGKMTVIVQREELIAWYVRRGWTRTAEREPFPYGEPRAGNPRRDDLEFVVLREELHPVIRAVVFDMDGLLIDSEPLWQLAEVAEFAAVGVPISLADAAATTGIRIDEVVALRERQFGFQGASAEQVTARIVAAVIELVRTRGEAKPGALAALSLAEAKGCRIGLASSSPLALIHAVIERLGLAGRFEAVCSAEKEPLGKPHPAVYLAAAAKLGVAAHDCLAIEDSISGVIAAKAARMTCLAVPDAHLRGDPRFVLADASIPSLEGLDEALWARLAGDSA